jgi:hypothetical protein
MGRNEICHLIGAEGSGLRVLGDLCPLVKIRRTTLVDEFFEFRLLFGCELVSSIAAFVAEAFEKELHANDGATLGFWALRRILPK